MSSHAMADHSMAYSRGVTLVDYGREVEHEIVALQEMVEANADLAARYNPRWLAIKLLEEDADITAKVAATPNTTALLARSAQCVAHLRDVYGDDVDTVIADRRYGWINGLVRETVRRTAVDRLTLSDKIDKIVTNRVLGIPIFLALMWVVFKVTTDVAGPFLDWVDGVIGGPITNWTVSILGLVVLGGTWVESLFVDGIIAGVGGVLVFVPVLMALYLALAVLEDSGYMARAAFVMDRLMHALGLHGKSFLPMLVGFGCTVPALYATRTLENEKDRILTGLLVPFMSCGARLPVYVLFAGVFFPENSGGVIFALYLLGIATAIVLGMVLKRTLFKGKEQAPFVMELPPYRMPTLRGIWFHMWERTGGFVRKAWTIILATSVIIWILLAIPLGGGGSFAGAEVDDSLFAGVSRAIAPVFKPLGFGEWEASGSLITGFVAKEVVVGSMAQVYGAEEAEEEEAEPTTFFQDVGGIVTGFVGAAWDTIKSVPLIVGIDLFEGEEEAEPTALMAAVEQSFETSSGGHGALASLAFMVFILLYTPCMVAVAAERQELGSKWMWVSIVGQLALAWVVALVIFQGGKLLGIG
jgi:ferrous iron transport protein B